MIFFEKLRTNHVPIIYEWFNEPHVQQFYSLRSWTKKEVEKKLKPYITGKEPVQGFVVRVKKCLMAYSVLSSGSIPLARSGTRG